MNYASVDGYWVINDSMPTSPFGPFEYEPQNTFVKTPDDITDVEWIAQVRKYALNFGGYPFSPRECERMLPYIARSNIKDAVKFKLTMHTTMAAAWDLMDDMERGVAEAVAAKLTQ